MFPSSVVLLCIGTLLLSGVWCEDSAPIVGLTSGRVSGLVQDVENGTRLYFYQGIRYGQAGRFEKPKFADPWPDTYEATHPRDSCPQPIMGNDPLIKLIQSPNMSEDCLYLNVWRPADEQTGRSVLYYVHGGAFTIGTIFAPLTDAQHIASIGDVVVVAVNYRLGAFGFMAGGDVPGNLGLHDQILGLKWVKDNIAVFGGDPTKVTIMGASAGSMSVGSLVLSPLTKDLFKRAVLQAGAPNSNFATISTSVAAEKAKKSATKLACPSEDIQQAMTCIKGKSMDEIRANTSMDFAHNDFFVPIYGDDVMPVAPIEALKTGQFNTDLDIMIGWTRDEGSYFTAQIMPKLMVQPANLTIESTKEDIRSLMESTLFNNTIATETAELYTQGLTNETSEDELKATIASAWGDFQLICPTILFSEAIAKLHPQNRYYSYRLMQSLQMPMGGNLTGTKWLGVTHGQDSMFIFMPAMLSRSEGKDLSRELTEGITAFVKTGSPDKLGRDNSVEWTEAFDRSEAGAEPVTRYLSLDVTDLKMVTDGGFRRKCNKFWRERTHHV